MFKLKRIYEYLGYTEDLLETRRTSRCERSLTVSGDGYRVEVGDAANLGATMLEPYVAAFDADNALVIYRPSSGLANPSLFYRLVSVADDLAVSLSAQATLSSESTYITGYALLRLEENRILVVYKHTSSTTKAVLVTLSAGVVSVSAPTTIDSGNFNPTTTNRQFSLSLMDDGRVILVGRNATTILAFQILTITGSTISGGTVTTYDRGSGDNTYFRAIQISGTLGVVSFRPGPSYLKRLTITSTVTVESTEYNLDSVRPFTGYTSQQLQAVDIHRTASGQIFVSGIAAMSNGVSTDRYEVALVLSVSTSAFATVSRYVDDTPRAVAWGSNIVHRTNGANGDVLIGWEIASDELVYAVRFSGAVRAPKTTADTTTASYTRLDLCYMGVNNKYLMAISENLSEARVRALNINT